MKMPGWWLLVGALGTAHADDCSDLARAYADNPQVMRVGDLDQLKNCVADLMQRKVQSNGDLPAIPSFNPPAAPQINLDIKSGGDQDTPAFNIPPPGLADH